MGFHEEPKLHKLGVYVFDLMLGSPTLSKRTAGPSLVKLSKGHTQKGYERSNSANGLYGPQTWSKGRLGQVFYIHISHWGRRSSGDRVRLNSQICQI